MSIDDMISQMIMAAQNMEEAEQRIISDKSDNI